MYLYLGPVTWGKSWIQVCGVIFQRSRTFETQTASISHQHICTLINEYSHGIVCTAAHSLKLWCNILCTQSKVYYTTTVTYFSMNSKLHAHGAPHVQCLYYLTANRITNRYPTLKTHCVPCDVLRTVRFSQALGSSCLSLATLAPNETSACTGHTLLLLIEWLGWRDTPAHPPPLPLFLWLICVCPYLLLFL